MSRSRVYRLKNFSVYVGVIGYLAMIISGEVLVGAWSKLIAEALRIPYYRYTDANDMAGLSWFFIIASGAAIARSFY